MDINVQLMDNKIMEFKKFVDEFAKMFEQGHLSVNMWKTQHGQLRAMNEAWIAKNKLEEEKLSSVISAGEKIKFDDVSAHEKAKADIVVLHAKAYAKYKEFERFLDEADKRRLKASLKELEAVAA